MFFRSKSFVPARFIPRARYALGRQPQNDTPSTVLDAPFLENASVRGEQPVLRLHSSWWQRAVGLGVLGVFCFGLLTSIDSVFGFPTLLGRYHQGIASLADLQERVDLQVERIEQLKNQLIAMQHRALPVPLLALSAQESPSYDQILLTLSNESTVKLVSPEGRNYRLQVNTTAIDADNGQVVLSGILTAMQDDAKDPAIAGNQRQILRTWVERLSPSSLFRDGQITQFRSIDQTQSEWTILLHLNGSGSMNLFDHSAATP